jgi:WD40 repeat protein
VFSAVEIGYARSASISRNGKLLATAGHDCTVRVFDLETLTNIFTDNTQTTLFAVGFSPDGHTLVAGPSWGGVLIIYEISSEGGKVVIRKKGTSCQVAGELHSVDFRKRCPMLTGVWRQTEIASPPPEVLPVRKLKYGC